MTRYQVLVAHAIADQIRQPGSSLPAHMTIVRIAPYNRRCVLVEFDDPQAPSAVDGAVIDPVFTRNYDTGEISVDYGPPLGDV